MRRNFEKGKQAIEAEQEKQYGRPFPPAFWDMLERDWEPPEFNPENEGEVQEALNDFRGHLREQIEKLLQLADVAYFSNRKKPRSSASGKRYQRCFEKRLYVVEFVMDRRRHNKHTKTFFDYLNSRRVDWKRVCAEWNEANPHDPMSPAVLKVRYYRAIAEEDMQREYYRRRYHKAADGSSQELSKVYKDAMEGLSDSMYRWEEAHIRPMQTLSCLPDSDPEKVKALSSMKEGLAIPKETVREVEAWREANPATAKWQQIKGAGGFSSKALQALFKVWYEAGTLTPDEETLLKRLHVQYPFGQPHFKIWLEQTLKQVFEKSVLDEHEVGQVRNLQQREAHHERPHSQEG